jgi:hypothetical protein
MRRKDSVTMKKHLAKRTVMSLKDSTLDLGRTIIAIEAKIHRAGFSGDYEYQDLAERFGTLKIDETYVPQERMPNYKTKALVHTEMGNLAVFLNQIKPFLPKCLIEISNPTRDFLIELSRLFPNLKVWSIEYALDIYCCDPMEVENLLWLLKRYLYVPYKRSTKEYGELLFQVGDTVGVRRTSPQTDESQRDQKHGQDVEAPVFRAENLKAYMRGPDELKHGKSWFWEDVDRVRLEFTATGDRLRRHNIRSLKDFIRAPRFKTVCENLLNFKRFVGHSRRFPKEWEGYNSGSFQQEHIQRRRGVKNLSQYIRDAKGFEGFKSTLVAAMEEFDRRYVS